MLAGPSLDNLLELLSALADEQITDAQLAQLVERLRNEPAAREVYREHATMQALLRREAGREMAALPMVDLASLLATTTTADNRAELLETRPAPASSQRRFAQAWYAVGKRVMQRGPLSILVAGLVVGTMLTLFAVVGAPLFRQQLEQSQRDATPTQGVARLTRALHVTWANPKQAVAAGQVIQPGQRVVLLEGLLEIYHFSGTKVVVEGPATVEFREANEGYLSDGRLVATVPERATGFKLQTPHATIVDLGTEFGVETHEELGTHVQVLRGIVEVKPSGESTKGGRAQVLHSGAALAISVDGAMVRDDQFSARPFHRMIAVISRPALPAHYRFDADYTDSSGNANHGVAFDGGGDAPPETDAPDGDTGGVSITTTSGAWKFGGGAASFTAERDYVDIPRMSFADGEAYSIAFWARQEQESIAFFIGEPSGGTYVIGLVGNMFRWRGNANYGSEPTFDVPDAADRTTWHHYAVVAGDFNNNGMVDGIRLYVDGQLGGTKHFTETGTPGTGFVFDAIGAAYPNHLDYDLQGQVDEVWMFDRTLDAQEVKSLFEKNVIAPRAR